MSISNIDLQRYHRLNSTALQSSTVFFGSDCFANIPVGELSQDLGSDTLVYNRSLTHLTVSDAADASEECIYPLHPSRLFINLGETDLTAPDFSLEKFIASYEWFLYTLNSRLKGSAQIYIVSVLSSHPLTHAVNDALIKLSDDTGCTYVDITRAASAANIEVCIFQTLRHFFRRKRINLTEAFQIAQHSSI